MVILQSMFIFNIAGATFLNVYPTVHFGSLGSLLQGKLDCEHVSEIFPHLSQGSQ
jgi:hypothetical protein